MSRREDGSGMPTGGAFVGAAAVPSPFPDRWDAERDCYLTTTGRVTGRPHEIEIWFAMHEGRLYLLSGRGERSDWVKNLRADPRVRIRVGSEERVATAHVLARGAEEGARRAWEAKYGGWDADGTLVELAAGGGVTSGAADG